jgi:hypothetical protein
MDYNHVIQRTGEVIDGARAAILVGTAIAAGACAVRLGQQHGSHREPVLPDRRGGDARRRRGDRRLRLCAVCGSTSVGSCYRRRKHQPVDECLCTFCLIRAKRGFTPTMRHLLTRTARRGDTQRVALVGDALRLLGVLVTYPRSRRPVRPLVDELMRSLPGGELVADAKIRWNHAITIWAHPADIWPWLVQLGCRRAGWYSYDGLDNGGVPSAERIVPELHRVQVADIFPMTPNAQDRFVVRVIEPDRALVLGDDAGQMSWAFVLEPADDTSTRLLTRSRGTIDRLALGLVLKVFWHPLDFGMQRRQLLNLKATRGDSMTAHRGHRGPT